MWLYFVAIALAVSFHYLVEYFSRSPDFLNKPIDEQRKIKNKIRWAVYGGIAFGCLLAWLIQHGLTSWARYLPLIIYWLIFAGGIYFCWLAYVLGIRGDTSMLQKTDEKFFTQPESFLNRFALTNLIAGLALLFVGIAIPVLKINFGSWGGLIVLVLACRKFVMVQFEKTDEASGS